MISHEPPAPSWGTDSTYVPPVRRHALLPLGPGDWAPVDDGGRRWLYVERASRPAVFLPGWAVVEGVQYGFAPADPRSPRFRLLARTEAVMRSTWRTW